jgi:hypothetical protein
VVWALSCASRKPQKRVRIFFIAKKLNYFIYSLLK